MSIAAHSPVVPFSPPRIGTAEIAEVVATLESGWLSSGPRVRRFETAFASYVGAEHAVALNSCSAGMHLALLASGIGPGDEVVTTPLTFCATANVILHCGATPVFADVQPGSGNIDPAAVAEVVTSRARAVIAVHYGGRAADVTTIGALARLHGLTTIEDAAHCIEGVVDGHKIGTVADFTSFSFYSTKNLTTGEGGMLTTASAEAAERVRAMSFHGLSRGAWARQQQQGATGYELLVPGFKYNMMDLQAAIGLHQLAAIEDNLRRRTDICLLYDEAFADLPIATFEPVPDGSVHARHLYTILVTPESGLTRDQVAERLSALGIATSVHFPSVHLHRYYAERFGFRRGQYPHAERISDTVLSLPLSPALTAGQIDRVIAGVRRVFGVQ